MTRTKANLEAFAQQKHAVKLTDETRIAHIITRTGWTYHELMTTPAHVIERLEFYWHLESLAQEAAEKSAKAKSKGKP